MTAFFKLVSGLGLALTILWLIDHGLIPFHPQQPDWSKNGIFQLDQFAVILVFASILITKLWNIATAANSPGSQPHQIGAKEIAYILLTIFGSVVVLAAAFAVANAIGEPLPQGQPKPNVSTIR